MKTFKTNDEFLAEIAKAAPSGQVRRGVPVASSTVALMTATLEIAMKADIHPDYVESPRCSCSCGNTFTTRSTKADLHVELCSECHPFYTGKQKLVDTGGRIERFERRYGAPQGQAAEPPVDARRLTADPEPRLDRGPPTPLFGGQARRARRATAGPSTPTARPARFPGGAHARRRRRRLGARRRPDGAARSAPRWRGPARPAVGDLHLLRRRPRSPASWPAGAALFARPPDGLAGRRAGARAAVAAPFPTPVRPPDPGAELFRAAAGRGRCSRWWSSTAIVLGEVLGLEVARVVASTTTASPRLEVGVGRHDREAFAMMHGDLPTPRRWRRWSHGARASGGADAPPHQLNQLAPGAVAAGRARSPTRAARAARRSSRSSGRVAPRNLKDRVPAAGARAPTPTADPSSSCCSAGVDLDLVPAPRTTGPGSTPGARLVLVVPERDAHPVTTCWPLAARAAPGVGGRG